MIELNRSSDDGVKVQINADVFKSLPQKYQDVAKKQGYEAMQAEIEKDNKEAKRLNAMAAMSYSKSVIESTKQQKALDSLKKYRSIGQVLASKEGDKVTERYRNESYDIV